MPTSFLMAVVFSAAAAALPESAPVRAENSEAQLLSSVGHVSPGASFEMALRLKADPGWHTYWKNPGDAGLATSIEWDLPEGFKASEIDWPAPQRFVLDGLASYGYEGEVWLLTRIEAPPDLASRATVKIAARADWLECSDICLPGRADLTLSLPVRSRPGSARAKPLKEFERARARIPSASLGSAVLEYGTHLRLRIVASAGGTIPVGTAYFYPDVAGLVEPARPQPAVRESDGRTMVIHLPRTPDGEVETDRLAGVLVIGQGAWRVDATVRHSSPRNEIDESRKTP